MSENKDNKNIVSGSEKLSDAVKDQNHRIPEEGPEKIMREMQSFISMSGPMSNPLMSKMEPTQISEAIAMMDKSDEREFTDKDSARKYSFAYFLGTLAFVVFLTIYFSTLNPDLLTKILTIIFSSGAGFLGGYGLGYKKRSS